MENKIKKWTIKTAICMLIIPIFIAGINYFMDPLWCFNISHKFNQVQGDFNERQQKLNFLTFKSSKYNGIVLGASTSAIIPQSSFNNISVFNFSINGLPLSGFHAYLNSAKKINKQDFEYIFIGLDLLKIFAPPIKHRDPETITKEIDDLFYRIKILISIDTLIFSVKNIIYHSMGFPVYYDRNNHKSFGKIPSDTIKKNIALSLKIFDENPERLNYVRNKKYTYYENYIEQINDIKQKNPDSKIIVFANPIISPILGLLYKKKLLNYYFRWLSEIVNAFGECYLFTYPNEVNDNYLNNFIDPLHFNSKVGNKIVDYIHNHKRKDDSNFGIYLNKDNFKTKKKYLQKLMEKKFKNVY